MVPFYNERSPRTINKVKCREAHKSKNFIEYIVTLEQSIIILCYSSILKSNIYHIIYVFRED